MDWYTMRQLTPPHRSIRASGIPLPLGEHGATSRTGLADTPDGSFQFVSTGCLSTSPDAHATSGRCVIEGTAFSPHVGGGGDEQVNRYTANVPEMEAKVTID
jgi:hypothetical protein